MEKMKKMAKNEAHKCPIIKEKRSGNSKRTPNLWDMMQVISYIIMVLSVILLSYTVSAWSNTTFTNSLSTEKLYFFNNTLVNETSYDASTSYTKAGTFEYCTNMTIPSTSVLNITTRVRYTGSYPFLPYATVRIRDRSLNILEELNDTDKDNNVLSTRILTPDTYIICLRRDNLTGSAQFYSDYLNTFPYVTISGDSITQAPAFRLETNGKYMGRTLAIPSNVGFITTATLNITGYEATSYYNDEFNDGIVNNTLWYNWTTATGTNTITETSTQGGYYRAYTQVSGAGGEGGAFIKSRVNINDGYYHNINISLNGSYMTGTYGAGSFLDINNGSLTFPFACASGNGICSADKNGKTLREFNAGDLNHNAIEYRIYVNPNGTFILYNNTGKVSEVVVPTTQEWYFAVRTWGFSASSTYTNWVDLHNYTDYKGYSITENTLTVGDTSQNLTIMASGTIEKNYSASNLANNINDYLNTCDIINGYCNVPFIYYSTIPGNFTYYNFYASNEEYLLNNVSYAPSTLISQTNTYSLNISTDILNYPTRSAVFYYNNTAYSTTKVENGNDVVFSTTLAPAYTGNQNFSWVITVVDTLGSPLTFYTNNYTQSVTSLSGFNVSSSPCAAGFNTSYIFSFADEEAKSPLTSNVSYNINYGVNGSGQYLYGNLSSISNLYLCINGTSPLYRIEYGQVSYSSYGYDLRNYYLFTGERLTRIPTNVTLYSLATSSATPFKLTIQNNRYEELANVYATILRWYPELNSYNIVEMGKTDDDGETVVSIKTESVDYRIGVYYPNGTLIKLFSPIRFLCTSTPCEYNIFVPVTAEDFVSEDYVSQSLTYNRSSGIFTYIWSDSSQQTDYMNLTIYRDTSYGSSIICSLIGNGYAGLLACDTSGFSGRLRAEVYRSASPLSPIAQLLVDVGGKLSDMANGKAIGLFLSFFLYIGAILVGLFSPVVALFLGIIALIPALYFGSISITVFTGITILTLVIIHFMRRT